MRIVPYLGNDDINEIESLSVVIKAIPFEGSFVPTFFLTINNENYEIDLDELTALMDGLEIAMKHVDNMINWAIQSPGGIVDMNEEDIPPEVLDKFLDNDED
jgi:hypothetical protein